MTIAIALSGGADSLLSLALLKEQGCRLIGLHAFFIPPTDSDHLKVHALEEQCRSMDIPFRVIDLSDAFETRIIHPFIRAYIQGKTPNPCAWCNRDMKFGLLMDTACAQGARTIATGHYVRVLQTPQGPGLFRGLDASKDQSYFLSLVSPEAWQQTVFPLGTWRKADVLAALAARNLCPAEANESQEICFIPDDYRTFLTKRGVVLPGPGPVTTRQGKRLGTHQGLWRYTQGQRKGLGIAYEHPLYVLSKDQNTNTLIVGSQDEVWAAGCHASQVNIMVPQKFWPEDLLVQTRYRQQAGAARVTLADKTLQIHFITPQEVPTPGQIVTVYAPSGQVLAGAVITQAL
ncbi:MAG: tRNA 2-thiouridine(34) synthase MnmA [Desulfoplanes sp.]|nr:tRNA 2-thiouridine(34) synthase MnmA [Desulfoplanes sp.]